MTGSIAVSQCGHTPNRPGHHGTVVAKTVGSVAISCNGTWTTFSLARGWGSNPVKCWTMISGLLFSLPTIDQ